MTATTTGAPIVTDALMRGYAVEAGVCVRPLLRRVVDTETGDVAVVPLPCGSTRDHVCPSCATKARRLRMQQCAEGWHLADELPDPEPTDDDQPDDDDGDQDPGDEDQGDDALDLDALADDAEDAMRRHVRSTRRRDDVADLPRLPVEARTVGKTWTGRDGQTYRPSMFITLTLPSYGKVDPDLGVPVDPARYDYRRAALDALHLPKLLDRWVQNTRRCAGYRVQYFAAIEAQRRLAGHAHLALRGAIPRATLKAVTAATYVQVWWPAFDRVVYDGGPTGQDETRLPGWDGEHYRDPDTRTALPTWEQAMRRVDLDATVKPVHSMRFGTQVDIKGLIGGTADVDRAVRYLTKYLTKSIAATHAVTDAQTGQTAMHPRMAAHVERMHQQLRYLPCSPRCANWLRYGVQPQHAGPGLIPGRCPAPAHDRENAGLGGRRVLVSRKWTGKTLTDHRADRAAVVRETLAEAGIETPDTVRYAADQVCEDGSPRFVWEPVDRDRDGAVDYAQAVIASVLERNARREQYERAKRRLEQGPPPDEGPSGPGCGQPFGNLDAAPAA